MKILIIDIETTGFLLQDGRIVELDLETIDKRIVFDKVINPQLDKSVIEASWIIKNGYMTIGEIQAGILFEEIKSEFQKLLNNYPDGATAFNRSFDFDFLESYGIVFPKKLPCPMLLSTNICKLPKTYKNPQHFDYGGHKWPKVEEAYKFLYP